MINCIMGSGRASLISQGKPIHPSGISLGLPEWWWFYSTVIPENTNASNQQVKCLGPVQLLQKKKYFMENFTYVLQ